VKRTFLEDLSAKFLLAKGKTGSNSRFFPYAQGLVCMHCLEKAESLEQIRKAYLWGWLSERRPPSTTHLGTPGDEMESTFLTVNLISIICCSVHAKQYN
jgi:hypothetical protein